MFKNVSSQSIALFAFDTTTGAPKTGDAANMLFYITKDWGSVTSIAANSGVPTEVDSTNAKGWYKIAVSQTETNADEVVLSGKSSTSNVSVVGRELSTVPPNFTTLSIDSSGRAKADVDTIKTNPVVNAGTITFPTGATLASTTNITAGTITTVTTVTNQLTAAQIATGIWQDTTAGDFTTALSVGKSLMNGVSLGTGLTVAAVSGLTASNLDAAISSRMATYTQPTGFLAATFPSGTLANTTNITAGTITTSTNLTNAPTSGDFTATMKTSLNAATPAVTVSDKTGFSLTQTFPSNFSALAISAGGLASADVKSVNAHAVTGDGHSGTEWGPA